MIKLTTHDYYAEINETAINIIDELLEENDNCLGDVEAELYDRIHETIDSHTWIIYTCHHSLIRRVSSNDEAYKDAYCDEDLGALLTSQGIEAVDVIIAFFAMTADVSEKAYGILDEMREG